MSLYGDFQTAWSRRFPGCVLPQAWEDDVRQNLQKHRQRVAVLKEELEKEAFYVEYLERLLADVERHKRPLEDGDELATSSPKPEDDVLSPATADETEPVSTDSPSDDQRETTVPTPDQQSGASSTGSLEGRSTEGRSVKQFVTVIEVNGYGRRAMLAAQTDALDEGGVAAVPAAAAPPSTTETESVDAELEEEDDVASLSSSLQGSQDSAGSSPAVRKKVPPIPPPKRSVTNWPPPATTQQKQQPSRPSQSVPAAAAAENNCERAFCDSVPAVSAVPESAAAAGRRLVSNRPRPPLRGSPKSTLDTAPEAAPVRPAPETPPPPPPPPPPPSHTEEPESMLLTGSGEETWPPVQDEPEVWPCEVSGGVVASSGGYYPTLLSDRSSDYDAHSTMRSQGSSRSGLSDSTSGALDDDAPGSCVVDGSPKYADYVNLNYFLRRQARQSDRRSGSRGDSDDEDEENELLDEETEEVDGVVLEPVGVLLQALRGSDAERQATITAGLQQRMPELVATDDMLDADSGVFSSGLLGGSSSTPPPTPPPSSGNKIRQTSSVIRHLQESSSSPVAEAGSAVIANEVIANSVEAERITMIRCIINSILESETIYWECLNVLIQYTKALRSTIGTSQPVISQEDLNIIFHKIPELHAIHYAFLEGVRNRVKTWDEKLIVGDHFKILASRLGVYASFLQNYPRAIETVRKCSAENAKFSDITKSIKLQALKGQAASLEDLLHKPVARVQKNALVLHDLLKYTPPSHPDHKALQVALRMTQCFLNEFNMSATESMFPAHDRTQRHLVKNSFIVELSEGHRKLRHLFLFNDVIVCAKYKATGRDKFAYEVKWYIPLHDAVIPMDEVDEKEVREVSTVSILSLKSQVTIVRDQIMREEQVGRDRVGRASGRVIDKHRKKLAELQAQLMLASPHLVFRVAHRGAKTFVFFLSSKFERAQWIEAVTAVQSSAPPTAANLTLYEIQSWITACHKFLQTNMGSFLLRSGKEDDMLVGDLHVIAHGVQGFSKAADVFLLLEIDCYGHFFGKAKTKVYPNSVDPHWDQEFIIELEGSQMLRILCYQQIPNEAPLLRGKATIELNKSWLTNRMQEKKISLQELTLSLSLKFTHSEMSLRRVPSSKPCGVFGLKLSQVMKKEKRTIPFLITCCVREVEKRGMHELGIYRVSGSASDMQKLKRAFESNPYEAEQLLKEVDIHSVTCILKLYLRELPEGLFTDELYPKFIEAFKMSDGEPKSNTLLQLYASLPAANLDIITYLVEHMVKVIKEEGQNKMSLQNIATVFGPTLLRPSAKLDGVLTGDKLAAGTIDVMAQATVLFFFLKRRVSGEPLLPVDPAAATTNNTNVTRNSSVASADERH